MPTLSRQQLLTDITMLLVKRQQTLLAQDLLANLNYWKNQFDIDTPLINEIIRQTEEYVQKFLTSQGCMLFLGLILAFLAYCIWGGLSSLIVIFGLIGTLNHERGGLFGPSINAKEVAKEKLIEKTLVLETNCQKHQAAGSTIPKEFANVKALRQAINIFSYNPQLTPQELFAQLKTKTTAYARTLTPKQQRILKELPDQIKSYYIFSNGRSQNNYKDTDVTANH